MFRSVAQILFYLILLGLNVWGIGWAFYRHGPVDGVAALAFPPYGIYCGIHAFFEEPSWKYEWDYRLEDAASVLEDCGNPMKMEAREPRRMRVRAWTESLPGEEFKTAYKAIKSYAMAIDDLLLFSLEQGRLGVDDPNVFLEFSSAHEQGFMREPVLVESWADLKAQYSKGMLEFMEDESSGWNTLQYDELEAYSVEQHVNEVRALVEQTARELFGV